MEVFDVAGQKRIRLARFGSHSLTDVRFSPDGEQVLVGVWDRVLVYSVAEEKFLSPILLGFDPASVKKESTPQYRSPAQSIIADTRAELGFGAPVRVESNDELLTSFALSADGETLGIGTPHGTCEMWAVKSGKRLAIIGEPTEESVPTEGVEFSPDGSQVAYFCAGTLHLATVKEALAEGATANDAAKSRPGRRP